MQRWKNETVGWWGAAARCMVALLPDRVLKLDDSAENPSMHDNNSMVKIRSRLSKLNTWSRLR